MDVEPYRSEFIERFAEWQKHCQNLAITQRRESFLARCTHSSSKDRPTYISEWDMPWPNEFRAESPLYCAAFGMLQDWSGFAIHTYSYSANLERMQMLGREIYADLPSADAETATPQPVSDTGEVLSDTGELYRNWKKNYGYINTPKSKCAYGFLAKNGVLDLSGVTIDCHTDFATIAISSLFHCRICKGVFDPITITCLVMEDGTDSTIFLSGDFVSGAGVIEDIRAKVLAVPKCTELPTTICLPATRAAQTHILLAQKYGNIYLQPQCAAGGNVAPRTLHYKAAENRRYTLKYADLEIDKDYLAPAEKKTRMDIALRICDAFDEVLSWASKEKITEAPIKHTAKTIYLEDRQISEEEYEFTCNELASFAEMDYVDTGDVAADFRANTTRASNLNRLNNIVKRYELQKESVKSPMELHVIRIGDIAFVSNAFELYQDFQHRIQARSPFTQTFIIQLTGQPDGYRAGIIVLLFSAVELFHQIRKCNSVKIMIYHIVKLRPHRQGLTLPRTVARLCIASQTGYRCQISLRKS